MSVLPPASQKLQIAEYTLGLLEPGAATAIAQLLADNNKAARLALQWEEFFLERVDSLPAQQPPSHVLDDILKDLELPLSSTAPERPMASACEPVQHSFVPRAPRLRIRPALLALVFLAVGALLGKWWATPPPAEITMVTVAVQKGAILQAPGHTSTPAWVVAIDPEGNVDMVPQVHTEVAPETSVQLWTYDAPLETPRSLGIIDPNRPVAIPAEVMGQSIGQPYFEMTEEPAGGAPDNLPGGPILYMGRVVDFGVP